MALHLHPGVLTVRDFDVMRHGWNFFDDVFARIAEAEAEIAAMRGQMFRLMPQDLADVQKTEIQPRGRAIVEEKGETKLKLEFDVQEFKPEEIKVKVLGNNILQVVAEHEEKSDSGFQRRTFVRQYSMPKGVDAASVRPTLTKDGVLTIEAAAKGLEPNEKMIPIEYKGDTVQDKQ